jgi:hypothetical protein
MHDRYFYSTDVLSIVLAFYWPTLWFIPVLYQLVSTSAISVFLFNVDSSIVVIGFLINSIALATMLKMQRVAEKRGATNQTISSALSWLAAILTPIIIIGISLNFLLTPAFIRVEYAMPHNSADSSDFTKSDRFQWASETIVYLTNDRQTQYLAKQKFTNGSPAFNVGEITVIENIKKSVQKTLVIWRLSLAISFILGLLAWAGNWLPKFRQGVKRGGWLSIGCAIIFGFTTITFNNSFFNAYIQNAHTLQSLFPIRFWQDSILFLAISIIAIGFLLVFNLAKIKIDPQD